MDMLIADVAKEDIKNCLDIYNYYIQNTVYTLEEAPLTLSEFSARVTEISKNFPYIVAKNERGEAIGYAYLNYFNERSAYRITANLSVYVAPDGRGKGTGAALLREIENRAMARGFENIVSLVTSENTASVNFHLSHGFVKEGELNEVARKFGKTVGVIFLRKKL